jgi:hypothetical protein
VKLLSERIEQADYDCETLWRYLEEAGHPPDGDAVNTLKAVMQTLLDCDRLAKRYEGAPVAHMCGECEHTWMRHIDADTPEQDSSLAGMAGQRVRILLDTER